MTRDRETTWERVKAATLRLGVPARGDRFTRDVLSIFLAASDLNDLEAELAFSATDDVKAWYRELGVSC
jgi:hypothetical protein